MGRPAGRSAADERRAKAALVLGTAVLALLRVCWIPALLETAVLRRVGRVLPIVLAVALGRMALAVAGLGRVASVAWLRRMPAVALLGTSIALVRRRAAVGLLR